MEPTVMMTSSPSHRVHSRLPSLNNLLESEVILGGDDDGASSCNGDESEMHSALEDLSESVSVSESKFVDCSTASSVHDVSESLPMDMGRLSLSQSYHHEPTPATPTRSTLPRSNSTLSNRTIQSARSRLLSPRQTFADATTSSRNRVTTATSPFTPRRSVATSAPSTPSQPTTPVPARKPSAQQQASPSPRPAVPPKPIGLSRQTSSLKAKTPESPAPVRRSPSIVATTPNGSSPAAKSFLASGKQPSVIRNGVKCATPSAKLSTTTMTTPPKRPDDRYATLGRRPKLSSPVTPTGLNGSMESSFLAASRETKATADKFATLPRRKPAKDRPALPKPNRDPDPPQMTMSSRIDGGATLPRPAKKLSSPTVSSHSLVKPRTLIYHEKSAQTELNQQDVIDGQEASIKLRVLTRQQSNNEEVRQLERMLIQSKEENQLLRNELEEEREERQVVQRELERTTQRVAAMLDSMEGVEREFHSRGDSLLQLETSLQTSNGALCAMQEQLEARDVALNAQRLELDRRLQAEEALLQQLQETEAEGREMMEFLQAEKLALQDAVRDSETETASLKAQIEDGQKQLSLKEEECQHLVRLAEQRRHELAAMQAELKGAEGRTGSVLMAQGARLSAAALALVKLHSRMDGLLQSLMNSHSLPPGELEALVFPNEAFKDESSTSGSDIELHSSTEIAPSPDEQEIDTANVVESLPAAKIESTQRLVGSSSLQDLSDAINLTRRRPPEGREEPNPVVDEELRLAASLVDQIEEADHVLSKLLRVLRRLILDQDSAMQQISDEKEQLAASLSAQSITLHEAKEELDKLRKCDDGAAQPLADTNGESKSYCDRWNGASSSAAHDAQLNWSKTVTEALGTLPADVIQAHPTLQHLLKKAASVAINGHDSNANGSH